VTLSRQLSWSHFSALLPLSQPLQREFYAEMCRIEGWSVRTLRERINAMFYERTALSKQPDALIQEELALLRSRGDVTPALVLKDPYVLDFLGLSDRFLERDLEEAILRELETFLLELGSGFLSLRDKNVFNSTEKTFILICSSITANSSVWL
jgi:predicted nuclease of restriction endonuclease-like (RecB) superfamily